jgi:UDP-N-acetylglucosamine 2-epimerase (non-hydrolysing)
MHILHIVGARPNFMKAAPVMAAFAAASARQTLVHTGQHYDAAMSDVFFEQLGMPEPDVNLAVGSGSHATQTAQVMTRLEPIVIDRRPDLVMVYGDVNSTMSGVLVCAKLGVPVAHVEAGLRSGDRTMPEEINRIVTDALADLLFTPSPDGDANLLREGVDPARIHRAGNVMIDTLVRLLPEARRVERADGLFDEPFVLVTLHRPSNVDDPAALARILAALDTLSRDLRVVFPVHPRTRDRIEALAGWTPGSGVRLIEPLGYIECLAMQAHATMVITDSGGIQEETTYLRVPCLTVRASTERPVTTTVGTNVLVGHDMARLIAEARTILAGGGVAGEIPDLWDGHAAERVAAFTLASFSPFGLPDAPLAPRAAAHDAAAPPPPASAL